MGKALYREYRPTTLETVVGQEHITNTLRNAITKGAISHAYLFTGPRGVGKTSVARILAHEINGIPYNEEATHLDIIEIDAASNRRIDEIRDLRDKVHIAPTTSKFKVYIIDEVHMLTREAFNALLKTLEEPPAHVVFILATTESHKVPETIISRTQRFSFKPISTEAALKHLKSIANNEKILIDDAALELIAEHGSGSFRDSISMLDQIAGFSEKKISASDIAVLLGVPDSTILESIIAAIEKSDSEKLFSSTQNLRESGANPTKTAQQLIKMLRDGFVHNSSYLEPKRAVTLMKQLLPLTGSNSSFEALEITLLSSFEYISTISSSNTENIVDKASPKKDILKVDSSIVEREVDLTEIVVTIPETELEQITENKPADDSNNSWNQVLQILKSKHNTLYGVLRMAETKVEGDKITLTFQFEFHKKQLHQAKNLDTLKAIVNEHLGTGYIIESEVIKKPLRTLTAKPNKVDDDTLSTVSNIFGGAELLES